MLHSPPFETVQSIPEGIAPGEVHLWRADLDVNVAQLEHYHTLLSSDERQRAARFKFDRDRGRYTTARGILRTLLSAYVQTAPAALVFTYNRYGKPAYPNSPYVFNVSHTDAYAVYAIAQHSRIGVDLESINRELEIIELAPTCCSLREQALLQNRPIHQQHDLFFTLWTLKEALAKAEGSGLVFPLETIELDTPDYATLLERTGGCYASPGWYYQRFTVAPRTIGALAVERPISRVRYLQFV
jgi:4'-phosphopantetheinyl transferase